MGKIRGGWPAGCLWIPYLLGSAVRLLLGVAAIATRLSPPRDRFEPSPCSRCRRSPPAFPCCRVPVCYHFGFFCQSGIRANVPRVQVKRTGGRKRYAVHCRCSSIYHTPRLCGLTPSLRRPLRFARVADLVVRVADQVARVADQVARRGPGWSRVLQGEGHGWGGAGPRPVRALGAVAFLRRCGATRAVSARLPGWRTRLPGRRTWLPGSGTWLAASGTRS